MIMKLIHHNRLTMQPSVFSAFSRARTIASSPGRAQALEAKRCANHAS
jgi:hypothetical protein